MVLQKIQRGALLLESQTDSLSRVVWNSSIGRGEVVM